MSKKLKITLISLASLGILAIAALMGISAYISSHADEYKHYLTDVVERETGMKLRLAGPVSVSVLPWIGIEAEDVFIENPAEFKSFDENLLALDKVGVELAILPLLGGRIEVGDIRVEGLKLGLVVNKAGNANWVFGSGGGETSGKDASSPGVEGDSKAGDVVVEEPEASVSWGIGSLSMSNSSISYIDEPGNKEYRFENISLETGNLGIGRDVSLQLASDVFASSPEFEGSVKLNSEFNFKDSRNIEIAGLEGKVVSRKGVLGQSEAGINLSLVREGSRIKIGQFALEAVEASVNFSGEGNVDNFTFTGPLKIKSKPRRLLELAGMEPGLSSDSALGEFSLNAQLSSVKEKETRISNIDARLDKTAIKGELLVRTGGDVKISGWLGMDSLILDDYMPAGSADATKSAGDSGSGQASGSAPVKAGGPKNEKYEPPTLGLDLDLNIEGLTVKGMTFKNIKTKVRGDEAVYSLNPLGFDFASARWASAVSANMKQAEPSYQLGLEAKKVHIEELLTALTGKAQISGKADVKASLAASGSGDGIMKSLGGNAAISAQGNINSLKLPKINLTAAPGVSPMDTVTAKLNKFSASFNGSGGVFANNDMVFDTSVGRGRGSGTINLGGGSLNYLVTVETKTVNLPIRISGPFSNLSYMLDAEAMLSDPENLRKGTERLIDKHGKDLGNAIEKGLGKLFGN